MILDPMFYIPFEEDSSLLDKLEKRNQQNDFSLLYVEPKDDTNNRNDTNYIYPLHTMFECYKDSIPSYSYSEFKMLILNELESTKSDQEIMECFVEIFGYESIDFLTEIIRHRNGRIDYNTTIYGNIGFKILSEYAITMIKIFLENGIKRDMTKKKPAEIIAGQVTVQSEKESILSKKLRKLEKKEKSKYSATELKQLSTLKKRIQEFHNIFQMKL